jgi:hypothetical protein
MDTEPAKQSPADKAPTRGGVIDGRTRRARRRRQLISTYTNALGGDASLTASQRIDVRKAAELTALSEDARAMALQEGLGDVGATLVMVRLQGAASRAVQALRLPEAGRGAPVTGGLHDIVARHADRTNVEADD